MEKVSSHCRGWEQAREATKHAGIWGREGGQGGGVVEVGVAERVEFQWGFHAADGGLEVWVDALADVDEGFFHPLDVEGGSGNGFRFDDYGADGLRWAVDRAMEFYALPREVKEPQIRRVMKESKAEFSHEEVARKYIAIYEEMLARPLVEKAAGEQMGGFTAPDYSFLPGS